VRRCVGNNSCWWWGDTVEVGPMTMTNGRCLLPHRNLILCERHEWWGEMSLPWWVDIAGVNVAWGRWLNMVKGWPVMWWAIQAGAGKQRGEEILVLTMHVVTTPSVITIWTTCHVVSTHHRCLSTSSFVCHCPCGSFVILCLLCQKKKGVGGKPSCSPGHCPLFVATSLKVTWPLHCMWIRREMGDWCCSPWYCLLFIRCWLPCGWRWPGSCFVCEKREGRGGIFLTSIVLRTVMTTCIISIWTTWHVH